MASGGLAPSGWASHADSTHIGCFTITFVALVEVKQAPSVRLSELPHVIAS